MNNIVAYLMKMVRGEGGKKNVESRLHTQKNLGLSIAPQHYDYCQVHTKDVNIDGDREFMKLKDLSDWKLLRQVFWKISQTQGARI